jgi:hypothetical protein
MNRLSYGVYAASNEQRDDAINSAKRALELDPLSLLVNVQAGWIYWLPSDMDYAMSQAGKMLGIQPDSPGATWLTFALERTNNETFSKNLS